MPRSEGIETSGTVSFFSVSCSSPERMPRSEGIETELHNVTPIG